MTASMKGINIRVVWTKAHITLEEKAKMSLENRHVAGDELANELLKMPLTLERRCMRRSDTLPPFMMRLRSWLMLRKSTRKTKTSR